MLTNSTYDGVAIAYATLSHVAASGCNTLFVTHYPQVAEELAKEVRGRDECPAVASTDEKYPEQISNWHMSFDEVRTPGACMVC
jgi:DNA mismatch repair protein MSH3